MRTPKGKLFGLQVIEDTALPPNMIRLVNPDGSYYEIEVNEESCNASDYKGMGEV